MARQYTREFKLEALRMAEESGNVTGTARTLGIAQSVLWRWKKAFDEHGPEAFPGRGVPRDLVPRDLSPDDEDLAKLRRRLRRVEEENAILKKAVGIFSGDRR